jgi:hypothetical protein
VSDLKVRCSQPCPEAEVSNKSVFALGLTHLDALTGGKFTTVCGLHLSPTSFEHRLKVWTKSYLMREDP